MIDHILLSPELAAGTIALDILPLHHHVVSDHRASYCDINVQALFSVLKIDDLTHGTRRKLQLSKLTIVTKYLYKLEQLFVDYKILQRIQNLVLLFKNKTTNDYTQLIFKFNQLDEEKNRYTRAAESHCNWSPPQGAYAWSPRLEKSGQTITY